MAEAIQAEHLAYAYPGAEGGPGISVFRDLNLKIEEGTFVAVLGRNGCGKSTLAKHCNAIALPEGGTVTVFGMDTQDEGNLIPIRRTVGMVFQNPDNQIVANVVEEDVAFAPENLGVPSQEIRRRVDEALRQVGLYEYREHAVWRAKAAGGHRGDYRHGDQVHCPGRTYGDAGPPGTGRGYGDCLRLEPALGHHRRSHHPPHG